MKNAGHIEVDGFKFQYLTEGNGPDVLVIGSSIYYPRSFSQNLRKFLRLHFVDYRGFAKGPEMELTFETLLDDIERVRQQLGLKKCVIIGHSAHGLLALEYAKKYKEHVSHVVIIGMPPHMKPDHIAMAQRNWDESVWPERKAAFERNMKLMPDEKMNQLRGRDMAMVFQDPMTSLNPVLTIGDQICEGMLLHEPTGTNGFGYDPLFWSLELHKPLGEATMEEKNGISHRAKAIKKLCSQWRKLK